jgi:uncharacterized protein YqgC (DUF456 family)
MAAARFEATVALLLLVAKLPVVELVHAFVPAVPGVTLLQTKLLAFPPSGPRVV